METMAKPPSNVPKKVNRDDLKKWYKLAHMSRLIDEQASKFIRQSKGWSYLAMCSGHEGIQLALGLSFRPKKDFLFPYYRDQLTCLSAGITVNEIMLNGLSRKDDVASGGRHMSNHFAKPEINIENVSSCVSNHTLHAVGVARAIKYYNSDGIAYASYGDASSSEGYVFEAINGASREKLPVIFVVQNNHYGISVPSEEQTANRIVSDNYKGIKFLHIVNCDGKDFFDSRRAMDEAIQYVKAGNGPVLVHADCVRIQAHSNSDRHELYRSKEELDEMNKLDPIIKFRSFLVEEKIFSEKEISDLENASQKEVNEAAARAEAAPMPDPTTALLYVTPEPIFVDETPTPDGEPTEKIREAINRTLHEEFRHNTDTFLWGQDVASKDKGGVFNVTKNMQQEFGRERVFNAPIAEDFIVGTANGMSRFKDDIRLVIEAAQFADYVWPAMEQIVETSHEYYRSNGQNCPNIVIRLSHGGYIGGGLYHSQSIEGIIANLPGVRVVMPSFSDDACGLLRTAIRSRGITFFLEPKFLYNQIFAQSPKTGPEHFVPFGKARIRREGTHATIVTYGTTVHMALRAASKLADKDVSIEVIDIRSIVPLDMETIIQSVKKTNRVLIVHENQTMGGFGGEIAARIAQDAFEYLDAPIKRVCSEDSPVPFSRALEAAVLVDEAKILHALEELVGY
ncbi:2-oxoisovalerate dehydrogenase [bacterium]|nr:MAG: 2-oxoisovalerate dehydrogenase [bacterium]